MSTDQQPTNQDAADQRPTNPEFVRTGPTPAVGNPAGFGWRWLFPLVTLACVVAVPVLARAGAKAVLDTEGTASLADQVRNPESPGYRAFVTPSPTALVVVIDDQEQAVGVALLASAGDSGGGTVIVVGANVVLPASLQSAADAEEDAEPAEVPYPDAATVANAWEDGGAGEVAGRASELFGIVPDQVIEARPSDITVALAAVDPLTFSFVDPLIDVDDNGESTTLFDRGVASLQAADVPVVLAAIGPSEAEINRSDRQVQIWRSWISAARSVTVESDDGTPGLQWYIAELARSASNVLELPAESDDGGATYVPLIDEVSALIEQSVPFPVLFRDDRPAVRLVNDVADPELNRPAVETIAAAGGLVTVIGNPIELGGQATGVAYFDASDETVAQRISEALGSAPTALVDPATQQDAILGGDFDIVVTIGSDYAPTNPGG